MKQIAVGFCIGILVTLAVQSLLVPQKENEQILVNPPTMIISENFSDQAENNNAPKPQIVSKAPKSVTSAKKPSNASSSDEYSSSDLTRVVNRVKLLDKEKLTALTQILDNMDKPLAYQRFDSEVKDLEWAEKTQVELEYSFYSESPLNDIGQLHSVECKTQLCKVQVLVSNDTSVKPSHYMDWSDPVAIMYSPNPNDDSSRFVDIYVHRHNLNKINEREEQ